MNYDIVTIGQIVADFLIKPVDKLPTNNVCNFIETIKITTGGCTLNTSIVLAQLGLNVAIIGKIGNDFQGDFLIKKMKDYKIDTKGVKISSKINTTSVLVLISKSGERSFLSVKGGGENLSLKDINWEIIKRTNIVHISGVMKLFCLDINYLLKKLKKMNKIISMDVDWDPSGKWLGNIESYLKYIDIFMPSYEEAKLISSENKPKNQAKFFHNYGIKTVVIKLGEKGCFLSDDKISYYIDSFKVKVIDTTGAGDAFCAGFLFGYINKKGLEECCILGNACGALTVSKIGANPEIESKRSLYNFIKLHKK